MNLKRVVEDEGRSLAVGQSSGRIACPICEGGRTSEATFSVTRIDTGLLYNCFRATCGTSGYLVTSGVLLQPQLPPVDRQKPYYGTFEPVHAGSPAGQYFVKRFRLETWPAYSIGYNADNHYVLPIFNPLGRERGYNIRMKRWGGELRDNNFGQERDIKNRVFMHSTEPVQSWYINRQLGNPRAEVVLVEDQISAIKLWNEGITSVALLGTELNEEKVREIAQFGAKTVIIALDRDATTKAFKHARKWGLAFPSVKVAMLNGDIKDTPFEETRTALGV